MPTPTLVTVTLTAASGLPEDDTTMDFAFNPATLDSGYADDMADFVEAFLTLPAVIPGTDHSIADFIGTAWRAQASGVNTTINLYDLTGNLDGSPHGSPSFTRTLSLDHSGAASYPGEVGLVLSFHADLDGIPETEVNPTPPPAKIRPAARRRGRVFVPWITIPYSLGNTDNGSTTYVAGVARPSASLMDTLVAAGALFLQEGAQVWSRTDEVLRPVVGCSVDNAFDTMRKRGVAPTARTSNTWA